jgi:hypothetical protein
MALTKLNNQSIAALTDFNLSADDMPSGSVLQVVSAATGADTTFSSSSYTNMIGATITPTTSSSKILVIYNVNSTWKPGSETSAEANCYLYKNGSGLIHLDGITPYNNAAIGNSAGSIAGTYLDSPNTTSAITYEFRISMSSGSLRINTEGGTSAMTLLEIAG